jgi:hypothetical protein
MYNQGPPCRDFNGCICTKPVPNNCIFGLLRLSIFDILATETVEPMNLESMDLGYKVTDFSVDEHPVEEDDSGSDPAAE